LWHRSATAPAVFAPAFAPRGLGATPTSAKLANLAPGDLGIGQTLRYMRECVRQSLINPQQIVREVALSLVRGVAERHWVGEIKACHAYARDGIRYTQDPDDFELVQTPEKTIQYRAGDCDDKATLLAALLKSLGHPAQFVAVGINGGAFSHVLIETRVGEEWIPAETILPKPLGWYPPDATSRYVLKV
jgi:transglutaminase-like putative cysteine protease